MHRQSLTACVNGPARGPPRLANPVHDSNADSNADADADADAVLALGNAFYRPETTRCGLHHPASRSPGGAAAISRWRSGRQRTQRTMMLGARSIPASHLVLPLCGSRGPSSMSTKSTFINGGKYTVRNESWGGGICRHPAGRGMARWNLLIRIEGYARQGPVYPNVACKQDSPTPQNCTTFHLSNLPFLPE